MNVLITDDEPLARKGLKEYIEEISFLALISEAANPVQAMEILQKEKVDLLLCDIQMPLLDGIQFVKQLKNPPLIIFTTAYPDYALQGYELDVVDYLLKPISFDRFFKAVTKANELHLLKNGTTKAENSMVAVLGNNFFFIKTDKGFIKLFYNDVFFLEAMHNYVVFNTTSGKYTSYITLQNAEESLPAAQFIKTHKSYIVNIEHIKRIQAESIWLADIQLPVSRQIREELMQKAVYKNLIQRKSQ
jgi:two-component system, LytTR family, response regulator